MLCKSTPPRNSLIPYLLDEEVCRLVLALPGGVHEHGHAVLVLQVDVHGLGRVGAVEERAHQRHVVVRGGGDGLEHGVLERRLQGRDGRKRNEIEASSRIPKKKNIASAILEHRSNTLLLHVFTFEKSIS